MKNFKDKLKKFLTLSFQTYLLVIGLIWIFLHTYSLLIAKRAPYSLKEIKTNLTYTHYIIFEVFIIFHFLVIIIISFNLYKQIHNNKSFSIIRKVSEKCGYIVDLLYWRPLEYIHDLIAPNIPKSGEFYIYLEKMWTVKNYDRIDFYRLILIFDILPKIITAITFLIEIVIFGRIKYFIYCISLIILPVLWRIFLKLFYNFSKRNIPEMKSCFSIIRGLGARFNYKNEIIGYDQYEWQLTPENSHEDGNAIMTLLIQTESIQRYYLQIKEIMDKIIPYVSLLTSTIYLVGGLYRLIFLW